MAQFSNKLSTTDKQRYIILTTKKATNGLSPDEFEELKQLEVKIRSVK